VNIPKEWSFLEYYCSISIYLGSGKPFYLNYEGLSLIEEITEMSHKNVAVP
jgi:hypothetical protein